MPFRFDNRCSYDDRLGTDVDPTPVASPALLAMNDAVANELGLSDDERRAAATIAALAGNGRLSGSRPRALVYAGHQFGHFVPRLGDGRAILLGEVITRSGDRVDVQLKGAGRTAYSRGGDGRAALGPVLREFLMSEAMHALGVPTTRALAAVSTGEIVAREEQLPGAVITRVARSHLRVGTFEYFAARGDTDGLRLVADLAVARHYPDAIDSENRATALVDAVVETQAALVAAWIGVGFVHGVMNTDNVSIAGETLDFGPCAFVDTYDPARTFSSIDHGGRYAFMRQPKIAAWNVGRLAEALLPLLHDDQHKAVSIANERVERFGDVFSAAFLAVFRRKLGLSVEEADDVSLIQDLLEAMASSKADFTGTFRALDDVADGARPFALAPALDAWALRYGARLGREPSPKESSARRARANPRLIPRNHLVEQALAAAHANNLTPFERLLGAVRRPYDDEVASIDEAPGEAQWRYRTFCGT